MPFMSWVIELFNGLFQKFSKVGEEGGGWLNMSSWACTDSFAVRPKAKMLVIIFVVKLHSFLVTLVA
jgi:hypothetical protein